MTSLEEWAAIEAAEWTRAHADSDAHVEAYARFSHGVTVQLCLLFSERARVMCDEAFTDLERARTRAEGAVAHLRRTNDTLEQAVRLQAMGRR